MERKYTFLNLNFSLCGVVLVHIWEILNVTVLKKQSELLKKEQIVKLNQNIISNLFRNERNTGRKENE